eukprot:2224136-Prymnesium_polylepis.1
MHCNIDSDVLTASPTHPDHHLHPQSQSPVSDSASCAHFGHLRRGKVANPRTRGRQTRSLVPASEATCGPHAPLELRCQPQLSSAAPHHIHKPPRPSSPACCPPPVRQPPARQQTHRRPRLTISTGPGGGAAPAGAAAPRWRESPPACPRPASPAERLRV